MSETSSLTHHWSQRRLRLAVFAAGFGLAEVAGGVAQFLVVRPHLRFMKNAIITGIIAATILIAGSPTSTAQTQESAIVTRAKSIELPEFKLDGVTLSEAVRQLSVAAKQSDHSKGVNFMITKPATTAAIPKISLKLTKVSVKEAAERIAKAAGVSVTAQDFAFVFDAKPSKP